MDGGGDCWRGRRWIDERIDRGSQSALDRFDGRAGELRHLHCGTRRRRAHILFGAWRAARRDRGGRAAPVHGDAIASPVASRRQTIERPDVGASRRLPCFGLARRLRFGLPSRLIIRNPVRPPPQILGFVAANPLVTRVFFLRFAGCGKQNLGFPADPSYTFADREPCVSPSVRRREVSMESKRAERSERPSAQSPRTLSHGSSANSPITSRREAICMIKTMMGTAATPLTMALKISALIGSSGEKLRSAPTRVAPAIAR